ncbi:MAG: response regulator [Desulfomonilaceae bacterium]|nr:response regulator [Desulfomonilaceae bacterium]
MSERLRVLIVEDSEDDCLLLVRHLRRGGYQPEFRRVETNSAVREALVEHTWDVVISDYAMPHFSAMGVLSVLRSMHLDIPCLIVSGTIGEETAVTIMKAGANDYIMKDNLQRLVPAIEREIREAEIRKERRRTAEALRESEERYRSLVDNIDIGVTLMDADYNVVMTNPAQSRLFSKHVDEMVGTKCHETFAETASICPYCPASRAMSTGRPAEVEVERLIGDEKRTNLRIRAFPTLGRDGAITGCIEVVEDITQRARMEEQLRQTAQLEAIGRLAGGVAHDFNNLLTAILGYSSVLLQQMPKNSSEREKVFQIGRAAERAAELTRQLLAFSRKQVLSVRALDLNPLIADFEKILRRLLGVDIELMTVFDPSLGQVMADPNQIEQILLNLAVNARDAMPEGGKLTMETANVTLDEAYTRAHADLNPGQYVMFSVADTGVGMDADTRSNIFDPFFTTKEKGKGTGLGLSTVYGIVKQHKGHVSVYSEPGRGSVFKIYLPCMERRIASTSEVAAAGDQRRGHETVLVVEDEEVVRNLACELLELLGYSVLHAAHPLEAIRLSQEYDGPIHLLLTDIVLPKMDGARLYRTISESRPGIKVLYVSGYTQNAIIDHGVLKPGVHFLAKPFTLDSLASKVREILDKD